MTMLLSFAIAWCLGWVVLLLLLRVAPDDWLSRMAWASLALGLGLGISSLTFALWLILPLNSRFALSALELGTLAIAVLRLRSRSSRVHPSQPPAPVLRPGWTSHGQRILAPALGLLVSGAVYAFWFVQRVQPHGTWDAFAMYNARARFFYRAPETWLDAFRISGMLHPDYPALVPGAVARIWTYTGSETTLAPSLIAFSFTASAVVLLFSVLGRRRGIAAGSLAAMLLCGLRTVQYGNDSFVFVGADQITDVPFAFFLLSALALALPGRGCRTGSLMAAGLFVSFAAWTKNEGILLVVIFMTSLGIVEVVAASWRIAARRLGLAMLGATPILALVAAFKLCVAPSGDILSASNVGILEKILDPSRYVEVSIRLVQSIGQHGGGAMVAFGAAMLVLGWRSRREMLDHALPAVVVFGLTCGYFLVYIITPHDLTWHQTSSQLRLLTQLWPAILLAGFLLARDPGIAFPGVEVGGSAPP